MYVFEKSVIVDIGISKLFDFHLDTRNLPKLSPPGMDVTIKHIDLPLHTGSHIELLVKKGLLKQTWVVEIEDIKTDALIVDRAIKSPFKYFRHAHRFEKLNENSTKMIDIIEYDLPFLFLNPLFKPLVARELEQMFAHRHKTTCELARAL